MADLTLPSVMTQELGQSLLSALRSWATLQPYITTIDSEAEAQWLMMVEREGKNRIRIIERIHCRLNKLRLERERRDLGKGIFPF